MKSRKFQDMRDDEAIQEAKHLQREHLEAFAEPPLPHADEKRSSVTSATGEIHSSGAAAVENRSREGYYFFDITLRNIFTVHGVLVDKKCEKTMALCNIESVYLSEIEKGKFQKITVSCEICEFHIFKRTNNWL